MRWILGVIAFVLASGVSTAQTQGGGGGGGLLGLLLPFIILIAVFYFFIILPQSRERKKKQKMLDALKKGDRVVTVGGIMGVVSQVQEKEVLLRIAEGVTVKIEKWAIQKVVSKEEG